MAVRTRKTITPQANAGSAETDAATEAADGRVVFRRRARVAWRIVRITFSLGMRYRVTGLAAEAAFWALLSLPPLALGLVATLGYLHGVLGAARVGEIEQDILNNASAVVSHRGVQQVLAPMLHAVLHSGRADVLSLSFVIALWSGSRALNVYVDTITIAYGLSGKRGIVRTRALSFGLYLIGLVLGAAALPLMVVGPRLIAELVPPAAGVIHALYWPVMLVASIAFLNTLYHLAVPERSPWVEDLPGTVLALAIWLGGSSILRVYLGAEVTAKSPYGSLSTPVAVLLWLYVTALAVLIGACLNAAVNQVWPAPVISGLARLPHLRRRPRAENGTVPRPARDADDHGSDGAPSTAPPPDDATGLGGPERRQACPPARHSAR